LQSLKVLFINFFRNQTKNQLETVVSISNLVKSQTLRTLFHPVMRNLGVSCPCDNNLIVININKFERECLLGWSLVAKLTHFLSWELRKQSGSWTFGVNFYNFRSHKNG